MTPSYPQTFWRQSTLSSGEILRSYDKASLSLQRAPRRPLLSCRSYPEYHISASNLSLGIVQVEATISRIATTVRKILANNLEQGDEQTLEILMKHEHAHHCPITEDDSVIGTNGKSAKCHASTKKVPVIISSASALNSPPSSPSLSCSSSTEFEDQGKNINWVLPLTKWFLIVNNGNHLFGTFKYFCPMQPWVEKLICKRHDDAVLLMNYCWKNYRPTRTWLWCHIELKKLWDYHSTSLVGNKPLLLLCFPLPPDITGLGLAWKVPFTQGVADFLERDELA